MEDPAIDLTSADAACGLVSTASLIAAAGAITATNAPTTMDDRMQVSTHRDDVYMAECWTGSREAANSVEPLFFFVFTLTDKL